MMTSAQVVETSVNVTSNSPSQDYTHPDDHNLPNYDMTPGFKPFTEGKFVSKFYFDFIKLIMWHMHTVFDPSLQAQNREKFSKTICFSEKLTNKQF